MKELTGKSNIEAGFTDPGIDVKLNSDAEYLRKAHSPSQSLFTKNLDNTRKKMCLHGTLIHCIL